MKKLENPRANKMHAMTNGSGTREEGCNMMVRRETENTLQHKVGKQMERPVS